MDRTANCESSYQKNVHHHHRYYDVIGFAVDANRRVSESVVDRTVDNAKRRGPFDEDEDRSL